MSPKATVRIFAKLEMYNPTGSVKDRVAKYLVEDLERRGLLHDDSIILEPTSGNTGIALAKIGRRLGYRVALVMPDNATQERRQVAALYGAEIIDSPGSKGSNGAIALAKELADRDPRSSCPTSTATRQPARPLRDDRPGDPGGLPGGRRVRGRAGHVRDARGTGRYLKEHRAAYGSSPRSPAGEKVQGLRSLDEDSCPRSSIRPSSTGSTWSATARRSPPCASSSSARGSSPDRLCGAVLVAAGGWRRRWRPGRSSRSSPTVAEVPLRGHIQPRPRRDGGGSRRRRLLVVRRRPAADAGQSGGCRAAGAHGRRRRPGDAGSRRAGRASTLRRVGGSARATLDRAEPARLVPATRPLSARSCRPGDIQPPMSGGVETRPRTGVLVRPSGAANLLVLGESAKPRFRDFHERGPCESARPSGTRTANRRQRDPAGFPGPGPRDRPRPAWRQQAPRQSGAGPTLDQPDRVKLPAAIRDAMVAHARAEYPNEACGLIEGTAPASEGGRATAWHPTRNRAASPLRYEIDPDDLLRLSLAIDDADRAIWGSPTATSARPPGPAHRRRPGLYPDALYLLVSLSEHDGGPADRRGERPGLRIVDGRASEVVREVSGLTVGQRIGARRVRREARRLRAESSATDRCREGRCREARRLRRGPSAATWAASGRSWAPWTPAPTSWHHGGIAAPPLAGHRVRLRPVLPGLPVLTAILAEPDVARWWPATTPPASRKSSSRPMPRRSSG